MLVLVALTLVQKLVLLLCPGQFVSPLWVLPEEQHRGNVAVEIIEGPLLPLQDYHHAPNVGGSVVVGALAVPFVLIAGPSVFAVRLVTVLFNAAAVVLMFLVLDRFVSRRAGWFGGLLLALAPPGYSLISITAWGTHLENNTLTLLVILLFLSSHGAARRRSAWLFAAGIAAGFATYFGYMFLVALGVLLAFEVVYDKLFPVSRRFAAFCGGFLIGFLPWVAYNLRHDFQGLFIYDAPVQSRFHLARALESLLDYALAAAEGVPYAFFFKGRPEAGWVLYGAVLVLFGAAVWRVWTPLGCAVRGLVRRRAEPRAVHPALYAFAYPPAFVVACAVLAVRLQNVTWTDAGVAHDARYATALYPFLVLGAAVGLDGLASLGALARRLAAGAAALLLALNVGGTAVLCDVSHFGRDLETPGSSTYELARFLAWRYRSDASQMELVAERLEERRPPEIRHEVYYVLGFALRHSLILPSSPVDALGRPVPRERYQASLDVLRERVSEPFKMYFEQPRPDDPPYSITDRASYVADWNRRHGPPAGSGD